MLEVLEADSGLLPSHGRFLPHPVHESWMASEAKNIWKKYNMPKQTIHFTLLKRIMLQTQIYNRITLPIMHYYYFYTILILLLVTFGSFTVGRRRPFINQLHRERGPEKVQFTSKCFSRYSRRSGSHSDRIRRYVRV
jgi:hypothetical protein